MNPDAPQSPRDEREARLTALLLGELSAADAAEMQRALAADPELAKLHARLQSTLHLVRETMATAPEAAANPPAPLRLAEARREQLLAHFKTIPLPATPPAAPRRDRQWLVPLGLAAALVAMLGLSVLVIAPNFARERKAAMSIRLTGITEETVMMRKELPVIESLERRQISGQEAQRENAKRPELAQIALPGEATLLSPSSLKSDSDVDQTVTGVISATAQPMALASGKVFPEQLNMRMFRVNSEALGLEPGSINGNLGSESGTGGVGGHGNGRIANTGDTFSIPQVATVQAGSVSGNKLGITSVTRTNLHGVIQDKAKALLATSGFNVNPPNAVFYNDRTQTLFVRGTDKELDLAPQTTPLLRTPAPGVASEASVIDLGIQDAGRFVPHAMSAAGRTNIVSLSTSLPVPALPSGAVTATEFELAATDGIRPLAPNEFSKSALVGGGGAAWKEKGLASSTDNFAAYDFSSTQLGQLKKGLSPAPDSPVALSDLDASDRLARKSGMNGLRVTGGTVDLSGAVLTNYSGAVLFTGTASVNNGTLVLPTVIDSRRAANLGRPASTTGDSFAAANSLQFQANGGGALAQFGSAPLGTPQAGEHFTNGISANWAFREPRGETLAFNGSGAASSATAINNLSTLTIGGVIGGGTNTYTRIGGATTLRRDSNVLLAGGTLDLNGFVNGIRDGNLDKLSEDESRARQLGRGAVVSGDFGLAKAGAGRLFVTNGNTTANTYTGGTIVGQGMLLASDAPVALGENPVPATSSRGLVLGSSGSTLNLSGANTFTGALTVNGGTLAVENTAAVGSAGVVAQAASPKPNSLSDPAGIGALNDSTEAKSAHANRFVGQNAHLGDTTINAGTLAFGNSTTLSGAKDGKQAVTSNPEPTSKVELTLGSGANAISLPAPAEARPVESPAPQPKRKAGSREKEVRQLAELRDLEVPAKKTVPEKKEGAVVSALGDVPLVGRFFRLEGRSARAGATIPGAAPIAPAATPAPLPTPEVALVDEMKRTSALTHDPRGRSDFAKSEGLEGKLAEAGKTVASNPSAGNVEPMMLEPETLRRLTAMQVEAKATSKEITDLVADLKAKSPEARKKALTTTVPDAQMASLLEQANQVEQKLAASRTVLGADDPEIVRITALANKVNAQIQDRADGIMLGLEARANTAKARAETLAEEVEKNKKIEIETAAKNRAYVEAKVKLEKEMQIRDTLNLKVMQETVDSSIARSSVAVITRPAEANPSEKPTFWQRITGGVERTARLTVDRDTSDVAGVGGGQNYFGYDPYFAQTEAEKIQSKAVLYDTIDRLKLNEKWGKKSGSDKALKTSETYDLLRKKLTVSQTPNTSLMDIRVKSDQPEEAALIANTIAESYREALLKQRAETSAKGIQVLKERFKEADAKVVEAKKQLAGLQKAESAPEPDDAPPRKPAANAPIAQPEVLARDNAFSTFSLNVSDVSFKLAAASLEQGQMPDPSTVRSEEFINAFDYRDPEALPGVPVAFAWERARYPFAHNRDLLRFSVKTAALGRQAGRPLNVVLLLDNSGSMERADRVSIVREALRVLASQLSAHDKISVITFARTPRLWVDGVAGDQAGKVAEQVGALTPEGGTNLEEAMNLGYQTALRHYLTNGINHLVLLTDGAANLGNVEPESLKQKVEAHRKQGIAFDCFGIGWEGINDDLLEVLARNGDGRYGFLNTPEEADTEFAAQLAGALHVAASDVKVQVEFNPRRVTSWRQIGYAKHQLTKEQFRDNTVDAAELAAQEAGNALYTVEANPRGEGPVCTVRVRFKVPGTSDYREHAWDVPFTGNAVSLEQASHAMRLAASASAFSEWLVTSPFAGEVTPDRLLGYLGGVPEVYGVDARPRKLEWMIRQAKSVGGRK